ncbi:hypothetical protein [Agrococcus jejuensis]|uniref:DUF4190 domain-containing protein n=1 Tax=Agrococcus jejuensis TaxID=399736 RepID=A0A1G8C9N7_9MICO|nr:hypothetical protein [Agrococcus jejuensis]SDH41610.1 hypothetical protein SAMN04489720_1197 [Agrococcus jejuensis]
MTTPPPYPGQQQPAPQGWPQRSFAPPQQFQAVPDSMLASQRSTRVPTRALVWGIVAIVVSTLPLLNWFTLAPGIVAIQYGIAARAQRLAGGGRAVWAIVLGALAILGSVGWIIVHFVAFVSLLGAGASTQY